MAERPDNIDLLRCDSTSCIGLDAASRALDVLSWRQRIPPDWAQGYWG